MKHLVKTFFILLFSTSLFGQDLLNERIRKLTGSKLSVYLERGIFHNGGQKQKSSIKSIRHSFKDGRGYERLVFDFTTNKTPRIYGYASAKERKIYIDFFDTELESGVGSFGKSKYVEGIHFFPITKDTLSVEVVLKGNNKIDVFYLENPGRLVVDIKDE